MNKLENLDMKGNKEAATKSYAQHIAEKNDHIPIIQAFLLL